MLKLQIAEKLVFIDWIGVEPGYGTTWPGSSRPDFMPSGIKLRAHKPILEPEPVIVPDKKWEQFCINGYATFMEDEGCIRCWYECFPDPTMDDMNSFLAYAESDDGINWRKPVLRKYEFNGSMENNILMNVHGTSVFKDKKAPRSQRYKLIWVEYDQSDPDGYWCRIMGATSSDGISWNRITKPLLKNPADTQSIMEFDEDLNIYVLYTRQTYKWERQTGAARRAVARSTTPDFYNWPEPEMILTNDPLDPPDWDYYTSGYTKWPGAKDAHLMFIDMYHRTKDTFDIHLATSRDSIIWHRPLLQEALIPNGPPGSFNDMMICATKGIITDGSQKWVNYVQCHGNGHNMPPEKCRIPYGGYWRSVIREDGYMSLGADEDGEFWTVQMMFDGGTLLINSEVPYNGKILISIVDKDIGKALDGFDIDSCDSLQGIKLWKTVSWKGRTDISELKGREVRLHIKLFNSKIYAIRFA